MKTLVVGLGNPVLSDDGVGWHVLEALRLHLEGRPDLDLELCCRGGLSLMERLVGYDRVVIIDAICTGGCPGQIHLLTPEVMPTQHSTSGHDASLSTALVLGRRIGAHLPPDEDILLVGIEAEETEIFSEYCTPAVTAAIPEAVAMVIARLVQQPEEA